MPFYRRRYASRYNRRRRYTFKSYRRRKPKAQNPVVNFVRTVHISPVALKDHLDTGFASFKLSDLPDYTDFTNLFDMYRIKWAEVTFTYDHNSSEASTSTVTPLPRLGWVKDYDDASALSTVSEFEQYSTYKFKTLSSDKPITIRVKPRVAAAVYGGGAFTSYSNVRAPWCDAGSPGVEHYGIKWYLDGTNGGSALNTTIIGHYQMHLKIHFQCKVTR